MIIIRNSIRQLRRTPVRTILFVMLLATATALCTLGGSLWILNNANIKKYENSFTTIGTAGQRESSVKSEEIWDAELREYRTYTLPEYKEILSLSELTFPEANYIYEPERRPYFGAYVPQYKTMDEGISIIDGIIIETTPLKDCIPDQPIKLEITRVLYGSKSLENTEIWFCDHNNAKPEQLSAGKTYVMSLKESRPHQEMMDIGTEFIPSYQISSTQVDSEGNLIQDGVPDNYFCEEITEGYYETSLGHRWKQLVKAKEMYLQTIPVTGTNNTNLLMSFYTGDAYVSEGNDISAESYLKGEKVCLVPANFARRNHLSIGDSLQLSLYYANYKESAGNDFTIDGTWRRSFNLLNAEGKIYPIFEQSDYIISGIYTFSPGAGLGAYGCGANEVIVPAASIHDKGLNNIVAYGPMKEYNTSFQISNGTIEAYLDIWKNKNVNDIEITFFDKGFSKLEAGIENMKSLSRIFLGAGTAMVILILIFFCYLFISKQRIRTAIERSLGWKKKECVFSLLSGIALLIIIGTAIGCISGVAITSVIYENTENNSYYNTKYGNTVVSLDIDLEAEETEYRMSDPVKISLIAGCIITIIGLTISNCIIRENLKMEPLELLEKRKG